MFKKIAIISISIGAFCGVFLYLLQLQKIPKTTGGIVTPPMASDIAEGDSINQLINALPIYQPSFTITSYDYSQGAFVVVSKRNGTDLNSEFNNWYSSSIYQAIPLNLFILQP